MTDPSLEGQDGAPAAPGAAAPVPEPAPAQAPEPAMAPARSNTGMGLAVTNATMLPCIGVPAIRANSSGGTCL